MEMIFDRILASLSTSIHFPVEDRKMRKSLFFLLLFLVPVTCFGAQYLVKADGTGDYPTIQAAINAAKKGDEVLLAGGVFKGPGNFNIDFLGKAITVRSQSGFALDSIIDAEGIPWVPRRGFDFKTTVGADSVVRDLTIINGTTNDC
jgi:hypothetical protein